MRKIWKFPLKILDEQVVEMPKFSKILSVQEKDDGFFVWAEFDEAHQNVPELRTFWIRGTGIAFDPKPFERFLFTIVEKYSPLVWHVYDNFGTEE